MHAYRFGKGN